MTEFSISDKIKRLNSFITRKEIRLGLLFTVVSKLFVSVSIITS